MSRPDRDIFGISGHSGFMLQIYPSNILPVHTIESTKKFRTHIHWQVDWSFAYYQI